MVGKTRSSHHTEGVTSLCDLISNGLALNFKTVSTILKYSFKETVFKVIEHCQRPHYVQYMTAGHAEEVAYRGGGGGGGGNLWG
jgi:hypothetical protein